jgi:glutamate/tyrosine decarboxylase-like PLP-dependent enzyme
METEVVAMAAWMLNGDRKTTGTMTSGGTESILNSIKSHRDWGQKVKGIEEPEMVLPISAHPAFEKGAHYFNVKSVHAPLKDNFRVDVEKMAELINENTVLLVGSAPCYPYGVIDPIEDIAKLALEHEIGCHVDSCLGGFMLPWVEKAGYPIYCPWDFRVEGVTSISADLHKYGYAAKPASVILYRDDDLRKHQFYIYSKWKGGIYGSPSLPGTRPGGAIAAAWAALKTIGQEGYINTCKEIMEATKKMCEGINEIEDLHVLGEPDMSVFSYTFNEGVDLNFYKLIDLVEQKGNWFINRMQDPPAAHHNICRLHASIVDEFLEDLKWGVEKLKTMPSSEKVKGQAAMYGMVGTIEDSGKIDDIVRDILLKQYTYDAKKNKK